MARNYKRLTDKTCRAFTLLEVLTVLSIISIFMGLLFPLGEKFVKKSRCMADAYHLRQIALAYLGFLSNDASNAQKLNAVKSAYDVASVLAEGGYIQDPCVYLSQQETKQLEVMPLQVGYLSQGGQWCEDANFRQIPISWVFIVGIPANEKLRSTPIAYSRGLNLRTGRWEENSTYGATGGFVAFLDGHVKFFSSLKNQLVDYQTNQVTSSIQRAVPNGARAYDTQGRVW